MDESPQYIKLCQKAHEVQKLWTQNHGDCFVGEYGRIEYWISDRFESRTVKHGFGVCGEGSVIRLSKYIWLPRLDQLMELAQIPGRTFDSVTTDFFNWTHQPYETGGKLPAKVFPTLEQVWLAFVMEQKWGKKWRDAEWVR